MGTDVHVSRALVKSKHLLASLLRECAREEELFGNLLHDEVADVRLTKKSFSERRKQRHAVILASKIVAVNFGWQLIR